MIEIFNDFINYINIIRVIDILLVLFLLYELYNLIKGTAAINIFLGLLAIYAIWKLVIYLKMPLLSEILGQFIGVGIIVIIIVFQKEIRKFLLLLGNPRFITKSRKRFLFWRFNIIDASPLNIVSLIRAIERMSDSKTGVLVAITRKNDLEDIRLTGVKLDASISSQLLESIFFKNSPLHDGAVIIKNNRIVSAKCILPVTENINQLPNNVGLRHRAALGLSEISDAIVIVVSEQTGEIATAIDGELNMKIDIEDLKTILYTEFPIKTK
jgi:uncharacterized protein (TIGR00159 family)